MQTTLTSAPPTRPSRLAWLIEAARSTGDIGAARFGQRDVVLANTPAAIHAILAEHADAFEKSRYQSELTTIGLREEPLIVSSALRRMHRPLIAAAFDNRRLAHHIAVMARSTERLQEAWEDGATIDIVAELQHLTLQIIGLTLCSTDLTEVAPDFGDALTVVVHTADSGGEMDDTGRRATRVLRAAVERVLAARYCSARRGDLVDLLLTARDAGAMTGQQMRDELLALLIAGYEHSRNALIWSLCLLAQHPAAFVRLHREVDEQLGARNPNIADLRGLQYTLRVVKEALRLYPPAYAFGRQAMRDLTVAGYSVAAGTEVLVSPYALHRRPDLYPDPERFDPQRFTPEAEQRRQQYTFLPFGSEPHACVIGEFSLLECPIVLALLTRRVRLTLLPGQPITPEPLVTLRPQGPVLVEVQRLT